MHKNVPVVGKCHFLRPARAVEASIAPTAAKLRRQVEETQGVKLVAEGVDKHARLT